MYAARSGLGAACALLRQISFAFLSLFPAHTVERVIDLECDKVCLGAEIFVLFTSGFHLISFIFVLGKVRLICAREKRNPALSRNNMYSPFQLSGIRRGFQFGKGDFVPKVPSQFNPLLVSNFSRFPVVNSLFAGENWFYTRFLLFPVAHSTIHSLKCGYLIKTQI